MTPLLVIDDSCVKKKQFFHSRILRVIPRTHTYAPLPFTFNNPYRSVPPMKGLSMTTSTMWQ